MSFDEIYDLIIALSKSQGFYGRLLEAINDLDADDKKILQDEWESQNFKTAVDFIEYIEG